MHARDTPYVGWWEQGEALFAAVVDRLADADLEGASLLPDWSRSTVIGHAARNADALVNLLYWARTGEETPMYPSREERAAGIAATAALAPSELRADYAAAAGRLAAAVHSMPDKAWAAELRTAAGRTIAASEVPWMRCREVWVHAVDLDAGVCFADFPAEVTGALIDDVTGGWHSRKVSPDARFTGGDRTWGSGPVTVSGSLADLATWITGRGRPAGLESDGPLPTLPTWL
ncbi:MAG: maleylpyruvate isomerase family mycothiol-dependent enzyme [Acidimicrobiales bacterium]